MSFCDKDPGVGPERVSVEVGAQVVASENNGIVSGINTEDDILCVLLHGYVVPVQVVLAVAHVWQLQVI